MKKFIAYLAVCVAIAFTSCTDFGDENQLTLPPAPTAEISGVTPASETVTFKVAPSGPAGYYAWLIVESATVDSTLQATNILKQTANGLAKGIVEYSKKSDTTVVVKDLTPYTVYQIYAVASSSDGVVSAIKNVSFRTLDDGGKPTPTAVSVTDTIVTITFHEPLQKGNGNVYVSYFAKNTVSGHKPLKVAPGYESYNPQDILVNANSISVDGTKLIVKLPNAPAGAYASVTYDAGAVLDLEGNGSSAYTQKADTLINGVPSRGLTVHLANKTWKLHSEFEEINPDTVEAFSDWEEKLLFAFADEGTIIRKAVATKTPTVVYNQPGRKSTLDVKDWGILSNAAAFYLPEEPPFGATIDLNVPAGAFEDIYGNTNESLAVEGNYLYSYGYDYDDVTGTYDVDLTSYFDGALPTESGIIIEKDPDSDDLLIKNLLSLGTVIKGTFDPVRGTISLEDSQLLMENVEFSSGISNILFVDAEGYGPVIFKVPAPGLITSSQMWGYYLEQIDVWYDAFTASTWTRTSTSTSAPASLNSVNGNRLNTVIKEVRKLNK